MRFSAAISLALLTLLCLGCRAGSSAQEAAPKAARAHVQGSIVGDWTSNGKDGSGTFSFKPDGTYSELFLDSLNVKSDIQGTYTVSGNKLTTTMRTMKATSDDPKQQAKLERLMPQLRKVLNQPMVANLVWKSPDEVSIVMGMNSELPLVRKKSG